MALTNIEKVRIELQDTEVGFYILDDDSIDYFLSKNNNNIGRTCLDCAKTILLKMSMQPTEQVDIFSITGSKAAEQYRLALALYIKSPDLNPVLKNVQGYVGGVSISDMQKNVDTVDNNTVRTPYTKEMFLVDQPRYF